MRSCELLQAIQTPGLEDFSVTRKELFATATRIFSPLHFTQPMEFFATSAKRPGAEVHKGCIRSLSTSYALGTDAKPPLVVSGKRLPARLQGDEEQGGDEAPGGSFGDMSQSFPRSESTMSQPSTAGAAGELSPSLATETQAGFGGHFTLASLANTST